MINAFRILLLAMLLPLCASAGQQQTKLSNGLLTIIPDSAKATLTVEFGGRRFVQAPVGQALSFAGVTVAKGSLSGRVVSSKGEQVSTFRIELLPEAKEFTFALSITAPTGNTLYYPCPFATSSDDELVLAYREGLCVPCSDTWLLGGKLTRTEFSLTEGHNYNMPWWGQQSKDGGGVVTVAETPFDAKIKLRRIDGQWTASVGWLPQLGKWQQERVLRYAFFEKGGYVAMCKYFRGWAARHGYVKTLKEKRAEIPNADRAVGGPVIYIKTDDPQPVDDSYIVAEFVKAGVKNGIFYGGGGWWSNMSAECVEKVNAMGFIASRYDIFTDFVPDQEIPKLRSVNPNWPQHVEKDEAVMLADGSRLRNWEVRDKDNRPYKTFSMCDLRMKYHFAKVEQALAEKNYTGYFIDVLGAIDLRECFDPAHAMTREQSAAARLGILKMLCDRKLVTGTEAGNMFMLPCCFLFEGLRSVNPLTMHQRGRGEAVHWMWAAGELPKDERDMLMVSQRYIVPVWQLTFGDCVNSYVRWEQQTNRYLDPEWTSTHRLFSILTGQPAMISVPLELWERFKGDILPLTAQIYQANKLVRYAAMVDHGALDADRDVQYSLFDNGVKFIVNFSNQDFVYGKRRINARDYIVIR